MDRRHFLQCAAVASSTLNTGIRADGAASADSLLVIIDLVGGNDGLNTVIPHADPRYLALRPTIAVDHGRVLPLNDENALHPALRALMPVWSAGELAIVHSVGSVESSQSHHRASEVMHRTLPGFRSTEQLAVPVGQILAGPASESTTTQSIRLALHGFDTHENQPVEHGRLLAELAATVLALREMLHASGRWHDTVVLTRSEFGRRAAENLTAGTDHGCASVQFLAGGRVAGGVRGAPPDLDALDERGSLVAWVHPGELLARIHL